MREIGLVVALFLLYRAGRATVLGRDAIAEANADAVRRGEGWLGLPSEAELQAQIPEVLLRAANYYYVGAHFPVMVAFLAVGWFLRPRAEYLWARRLVAAQTFLALILTVAVPLAPPRMFPEWGFIDTGATLGPSPYGQAGATLSNQLAAMPSLHVGWALLIAYVLLRTGPRWLQVAAVGHVVVTVAVVIVTAHHWWLDGVVACLLLILAAAAFPPPQSPRRGMLALRASVQVTTP